MNAKIIGMIVLEAVGFVLAIVSILGFIPLVGAFVGLVMIIAGALLPDVKLRRLVARLSLLSREIVHDS